MQEATGNNHKIIRGLNRIPITILLLRQEVLNQENRDQLYSSCLLPVPFCLQGYCLDN
jgi:hypothetical protein